MKLFEIGYYVALPFLPNLYNQVRKHLFRLITGPSYILDVGGRKSHYTIGVPGKLVISDLPRISAIQERLHLGINQGIIDQTLKRRSNIEKIVYDDMTQSNFPDNSFDGVVAVEVLEHVVQDDRFLSEVARVLKPGGFFLMTTPNGDWIKNTNPDHIRHYHRDELGSILDVHFTDTEVTYAVKSSKYYRWGLKSWSIFKPIQTIKSILGNLINNYESGQSDVSYTNSGTNHLVAIAKKAPL